MLEAWPDALDAFGRVVALAVDVRPTPCSPTCDPRTQTNRFKTMVGPQDGQAWSNIAAVQLRLGHTYGVPVHSRRLIRRILTTVPRARASGDNLLLARAEAHRALKEALKQSHDSWQIWENMLNVSMQAGELADAVHAFHRLLDLRPSHAIDSKVRANSPPRPRPSTQCVCVCVCVCDTRTRCGLRTAQVLEMLVDVYVDDPTGGRLLTAGKKEARGEDALTSYRGRVSAGLRSAPPAHDAAARPCECQGCGPRQHRGLALKGTRPRPPPRVCCRTPTYARNPRNMSLPTELNGRRSVAGSQAVDCFARMYRAALTPGWETTPAAFARVAEAATALAKAVLDWAASGDDADRLGEALGSARMTLRTVRARTLVRVACGCGCGWAGAGGWARAGAGGSQGEPTPHPEIDSRVVTAVCPLLRTRSRMLPSRRRSSPYRTRLQPPRRPAKRPFATCMCKNCKGITGRGIGSSVCRDLILEQTTVQWVYRPVTP